MSDSFPIRISDVVGADDRTELKGRLYAFNVVASRALTPGERQQLRAIVNYLKPAHTHFIDLIEPTEAVSADHWELGISELGTESLLH